MILGVISEKNMLMICFNFKTRFAGPFGRYIRFPKNHPKNQFFLVGVALPFSLRFLHPKNLIRPSVACLLALPVVPQGRQKTDQRALAHVGL